MKKKRNRLLLSSSPHTQLFHLVGSFFRCACGRASEHPSFLPGGLRDEEAEVVTVLLRQPDESLLRLGWRADLLAEGRDDLRVERDGLSPKLVQVLETHQSYRDPDRGSKDSVLEGQVLSDGAWGSGLLSLSRCHSRAARAERRGSRRGGGARGEGRAWAYCCCCVHLLLCGAVVGVGAVRSFVFV